ncbi:MAG: PilZ domain-containing protein [Terracidiphilus sp.]
MDGRMEKRRLSVEIPLRLMDADFRSEVERTVTVSVSPHGARVKTKRTWLPNEQIGVTSLARGFNMRARVVYCEHRGTGDFCIGLEFRPGIVDWQLFARS